MFARALSSQIFVDANQSLSNDCDSNNGLDTTYSRKLFVANQFIVTSKLLYNISANKSLFIVCIFVIFEKKTKLVTILAAADLALHINPTEYQNNVQIVIVICSITIYSRTIGSCIFISCVNFFTFLIKVRKLKVIS